MPVAVYSLAIFAACSSGDGPTDPDGGPNDPVVAVAISPTGASLDAGATRQFTATVTGTTNTAVTWEASGGTISGSGATISYTAPVQAGSYTVRATSVVDPSKSATANVTVAQILLSVNPAQVTLETGGTITFTAAIVGAANTDVTWQVTCGALNASGATATYTAPGTPGECTLTVASVASPSVTATATIQVQTPPTSEFVVNATNDADDGTCDETHCSLREALTAAMSAGAVVGSGGGSGAAEVPGAPKIRFAESLAGQTITLTATLPDILSNVEIIGPGPNQLTIDASSGPGAWRRVFAIANGANVVISGLTVTGGSSDGNVGGGGIIITGEDTRATLTHLRIEGNHAPGGEGGGLLVTGGADVVLDDVWIAGNTAPSGGGVAMISASIQISNSTITGNQAVGSGSSAGRGGGLSLRNGHAELVEVVISDNEAATDGGGVSLNQQIATLAEVFIEDNIAGSTGGGIFMTASAVEADWARVTGNTAGQAGGGIYVDQHFGQEGGEAEESGLSMRFSLVSENEAPGAGGIAVAAGGIASIRTADITDNRATSVGQNGGGIWVTTGSSLTLEDVEVSGNTAAGRGGGIAVQGTGQPDGFSTLEASNSNISSNEAGNAGGGLFVSFADAALTSVLIALNHAGAYGGGAAFDFSTGTLVDVFVDDNSAATNGGGLSHRFSAVQGSDVTIVNNQAGGLGGGIFVDGTLNAGPDGLELFAAGIGGNTAPGGGGIRVTGAGLATLVNSLVVENTATLAANGGAGIWVAGGSKVTLLDTDIVENEAAGPGGGILVQGGSTVEMDGGEILSNLSGSGGGAGFAIEGGSSADLGTVHIHYNTATGGNASGGGITVRSGSSAELTRSTVERNSASGLGGGIYVTTSSSMTLRSSTVATNQAVHGAGVAADLSTVAMIENSTFSGNKADENGAAVYVTGDGTAASLLNTTIVDNLATEGFGGGFFTSAGTVRLVNTLLARNQQWNGPANCAGAGGTMISEGHNLSDDASCAGVLTAGGDLNQANANVSPELDDFGGPTPTHALLAGSDAIDAADAARCPVNDQRGYGRSGTCDIGAFEFGGVEPDPGPNLSAVWEE
ncbi:MAG TPA: right-handed parallel beta-helix repeat-containing protein [Longimicrobiales bacterium]|nr:right-handed parallel beta-helix repeat-containing protein [Longimicrobiales bacterium]